MGRGKILWADDEPGRFAFAAWELTDAGWEIDWAADATTAAEKLGKGRYDVVILDQMLPLNDGVPERPWGGCLLLTWLRGAPVPGRAPPAEARPFEALRQIAAHPGNVDVPVVLASSFYDPPVVEATRAISDGEIAFFDKPLDVEELKVHLEQLVERPSSE